MNEYKKYYEEARTTVIGLAFTVGASILIDILAILGLLNPVWNWVLIGATLVISAFYAWALHDTIRDANTYKRLAKMEEDPEEES